MIDGNLDCEMTLLSWPFAIKSLAPQKSSSTSLVAGHSLDLKPRSLLIPPTVSASKMPNASHGSHFKSNCLSLLEQFWKILKQYFEFKLFKIYGFFKDFSSSFLELVLRLVKIETFFSNIRIYIFVHFVKSLHKV